MILTSGEGQGCGYSLASHLSQPGNAEQWGQGPGIRPWFCYQPEDSGKANVILCVSISESLLHDVWVLLCNVIGSILIT